MDLFEAIRNRRSCRSFNAETVPQEIIEQLLEAAAWAPSPLNTQPWQFIVITDKAKKDAIFSEADRCRKWALEESGWKWLAGYPLLFLNEAPVIIAVIGDPRKTGVDMFQEEGRVGYQLACAAATQNLLLAAHALGLGALWFTFFDKSRMREILDIPEDKTPVSLICIGKASGELPAVPRKDIKEKTIYI
jgi:5,6-dimethylbenzimidazole synthase